MKKNIIVGAIITIAIIAATYLSQPKVIINDTGSYDISNVVYNGVDVTEQVDCNELSSIVSKYKCSRVPHAFAPYQLSQVVVEINGINGNNPLHIILGDINVAYGSGNKGGFSIINSHALLNEIRNAMPYLTEEARGLEGKNVITFSDGKSADLWTSVYGGSDDIYKLSDGTTLLTIQAPAGPENVFVGGVESFDDLSDAGQKAVSAYYAKQGLLYDTPLELQKAYTEYQACKQIGTEYHSRHISQDIAPTASNDHIMCFLTAANLPVNGQISQEIRLGAVFDRKTGEALCNWDLFMLSEAETREWLLDAFHVDSNLRTEMEAVLKPEYIILFPEHLEVTFPQGTLPSQAYGYGITLEYRQLTSVLHSWAIPNE